MAERIFCEISVEAICEFFEENLKEIAEAFYKKKCRENL